MLHGCHNALFTNRKRPGEVSGVFRLLLCVGLFAFGYYVGRRSSHHESLQEDMPWEGRDGDEV